MKEYKENGVLVDLPALSTLTQSIANSTIDALRQAKHAIDSAEKAGVAPQPFAFTASFFHPHAPLLVTADLLMA